MQYLILAVVTISGAGLAVETAMNTRLREAVGSPTLGGLVSFGVGLLSMSLLLLFGVLGRGRLTGLHTAPWWAWFGGSLGAFSVVASVLGLQKAGAGSVVAATVFGELLMGLLLDSLGLLNVERVPINAWRIVGAVLLFVGALLIQKR